MKKYIVIEFPEIQEVQQLPGFKEHCCLINDDAFVDMYGSSAYFVDEDWYNAANEECKVCISFADAVKLYASGNSTAMKIVEECKWEISLIKSWVEHYVVGDEEER